MSGFVRSRPSLAEANPRLAAEWDTPRNGGLTPQAVTCGSGRKVWWLCPECGHEWQSRVVDRNLGSGCPECAKGKGRGRPIAGENDLATTHPDLAAEWHPTRNGDRTPLGITRGSGRKVWWLCPECGHEWQATVNNRSRGVGCPCCAGMVARPGFNDLATTHPGLAAQWHPTRNSGFTPQGVTHGSARSVWWMCEKGHEWEAQVRNRVEGRGCPFCAGKIPVPGENDLATTDPALAAQWHPEKNGSLSPKMFVRGSHRTVWWKCPSCGHEWEAAIKTRSRGSKCPRCHPRGSRA